MSKTLALAGECAPIAVRLQTALAEQGHWVINSFDLQSARTLTPESCPCPHHHTMQCTCQYIVLIVYAAQGGPPCTVALHEFEGVTRATLDDPDGMLAALLTQLQEKPGYPTEQETLET